MAFGFIAALIAIATSAGVYYQQKKMEAQARKQANEAKAVQLSGHDSNRGLYTVYGKTLVGSTVVWKKVSDKQARITQTGFTTFSAATGTDLTANKDWDHNRWLYRAVTLCNGPVESVTNVTIDDESYESPRFTNGADFHFATSVSLGPTAGQNFSALRNAYASDFATWDSNAVGKGVCYAMERMYLSKNYTAFQGEPQTRYVVKGRKVYDPRKDSTSSAYDSSLGVSSHRADTASTWQWSDNPVICLLDYLRNEEYGRGLPLSVIDIASIATAADKCDVLVDVPAVLTNDTGDNVTQYDPETGITYITTPLGTFPYYRPDQETTGTNANKQKRFRLNIAVDPAKEILENIQEILNVFRGNLSYANGKYIVHMADVENPVLTLDDDDIIGGLKIANGDRSQRMNRATVKFINQNKQHKTDQISWPSIDSNRDGNLYATYLSEDEDEKLHRTFTVKGCTDFYQAQDTAEFLVRDSRSNLTVTGTFGSRCFGLVPGDVISLTYDSAGFSGKYFRVLQANIDLVSMNVQLQLKEYDSSVYTWNSTRANEPLGLSWQEEVVNAAPTSPTIGTITTNTRTQGDDSARTTLTIAFSGVPEDAQYAEISWAINGTNDYNTQLIFDTANQTSVEVGIDRDGQTYAIRLRYFAANDFGTLMPSAYATTTHAVASLTGTKLDGIATGATANTGALADLDSVDTAQIDDNAVNIDKLADAIQSTNYSAQAGSEAGWRLTTDGTFTAQDGNFRGGITATSGTFAGSVNVNSSGKMYGGSMTTFNNGSGFFLGYDTDAYKFSVGDSTSKVLTWDGDNLNVQANVVSFTTGGEPDYDSNSRFPTSMRSSVLDLGSNTAYVFFDNKFDQNLTLFVSYYAGPLTSGSISGETNAKNAVMSQLSMQVQYAPNNSGSPGTWTNFGNAAISQKKYTSGDLISNYYVKTTDLGGGNYRADLATKSQAASDFTGLGYSEFAYGITDEEYYMTERVTQYAFPKGEYFFRVVVTVTDGSYTPYPASGSPSVSNNRRLSIPNALTYTDSDHGQSAVSVGNDFTYFTNANFRNQTLIDGGSISLMAPESDSTSNRYAGIFIGGRGADTSGNYIQPLGGIYFYEDMDDMGQGAGSVGSPDYTIYMPTAGGNLHFSGNVNFEDNVDVDGTLSINGVTVNAGAVTGPAGSDGQIQYNNGGALGGSSNLTFDDSTNTLSVTNLTVSGTTTTIDTTNLNVSDKNITLNYGSGDTSANADGAGITIQDAVNSSTDATILWDATNDEFDFSHGATFAGDVFLNGSTLKQAAPVYKRTIGGVNSSSYTTAFKVEGRNLGSAIRASFSGTSSSVVINVTADIMVGHYQDVLIKTDSLFYKKLTIKVISDTDDNFAVEIKHNGSTSTAIEVEVHPLNNETITFPTSHSITGTTLIHQAEYGITMSATGGATANIETDGTITSGAITSTGALNIDLASGTSAVFNSGTTNVVASFRSEDATAWIDLQDSDSGTYGVLIGHDTTNLLKIADTNVANKFTLSNDGDGTFIGSVTSQSSSGGFFYAENTSTSLATDALVGGFLFKNNDTSGTEPHYAGMTARTSNQYGSMSLEFFADRGDYEADLPAMVLYADSAGATTNTLNLQSSTAISNATTITSGAINSSSTIKSESASGGFIKLKRADTTTGNNNDIGAIDFEHTDSDDAGVAATILVSGDGSAGGAKMRFYTGTPTTRAQRLIIDSEGSIIVPAQTKFYFDGGSDTYIHEASADDLRFVVGGHEMMRLDENGNLIYIDEDVRLRETGTATSSTNYPSKELNFQASGWDVNNSVARSEDYVIRAEAESSNFPDINLVFYEESAASGHKKLVLHGRGSGSAYQHPDSATFYGNVTINQTSDSTGGGLTVSQDSTFNGQVEADTFLSGVGSAASPAYKVGDSDTGFYDSGGNEIGVACGGVLEFEFTATHLDLKTNDLITDGTVLAGLGSAASPSYKVGDSNSGFFDSGANEIGVSLSGALEYEFTPTQFDMTANNLLTTGTISSGIITANSGTGNIAANFVSTDAACYINIKDNSSGTFGAMIGAEADDILFAPNNVEKMRLYSTGKLLIGSDSGDGFNGNAYLRMQQSGTSFYMQMKSDTDRSVGLLLGDTADDFVGGFIYDNDQDGLELYAANAKRLDLKYNGYIVADSASQVRMVLGSTGSWGGNTSNWIRGNGSSLQFNSASGDYTWEVGGVGKMKLLTSGELNLGAVADKLAQPVFRKTVTGISNAGFTNICNVAGNGLASAVECSFTGTTSSVVVNVTAEILVNHYKDIIIKSTSGFYTTLTIRVISDNNEDFSIQAKTNSANSLAMACEIRPLSNEAITFSTTAAESTRTLDHTCHFGIAHSSTGGYKVHYKTDGDITLYNNDSGTNHESNLNLPRGGFITFYGNAAGHHGICSRDSAGNVTDDLRINSYADVAINLDSNSNNSSSANFWIGRHGSSTGTMDMLMRVDGESGDITTEGNVTAYGNPSDIRLKENIEVIPDALDKVMALEGVTFNYKKDGKRSTGLIAQQLQAVLPEVVYTTEDIKTKEEHLAVRYGNVVGLLVESIKELKKENDELRDMLAQIMEKLNGDH